MRMGDKPCDVGPEKASALGRPHSAVAQRVAVVVLASPIWACAIPNEYVVLWRSVSAKRPGCSPFRFRHSPRQ